MAKGTWRQTRYLKWPKTLHQGCVVFLSVVVAVKAAITVGLISAVLGDPVKWMPKDLYAKYPGLESMLIALGGVAGFLIVSCLIGCCGVYYGNGWLVVTHLIVTVIMIAAEVGVVTLIMFVADEAESWTFSQANCPICRYDFQRAFRLINASTTLIIICAVLQVFMLYFTWKVLKTKLYHDSLNITTGEPLSWSSSPASSGARLIRKFLKGSEKPEEATPRPPPRLSLYPMFNEEPASEPLPQLAEIHIDLEKEDNVTEKRIKCDCVKCHPLGEAEPSEYSKEFAATQNKLRSLLSP